MDDGGTLPLMAQTPPDEEIGDALRVARETLPKKEYKPFNVLPLKEDEQGVHFDPYAGALGAVTRPFRYFKETMTGEKPMDVTSPEAIQSAADLGSAMTLGSGAFESPEGALRAGIKAYHGSPHLFAPTERNPLGEFDLSKIGTGEGAQVFGHGVYLADLEDVANEYRYIGSNINPDIVKYNGKTIQQHYVSALKEQDRARRLNDRKAVTNADAKVYFWENLMTGNHPKQVLDTALKDMEEWPELVSYTSSIDPEKFSGVGKAGHMYEAEIAAEPHQLLDWDKSLSDQPNVVQSLAREADLSHISPGNRTRRQIEMWREGNLPNRISEPTGHVLHRALTDYGKNIAKNAELSSKLQKLGIPGIQYLDAGSRDAGEGTHNYVIFNPSIIDIKRRYADGGEVSGSVDLAPQDDDIQNALRLAKEPVRYDTGPQPGEPILSSYDPTIKERIYQTVAGTETRPSPERAGFARGVSQMAEFAPFLGDVMAGQEAYRRGDTKGMLMAAVPLPGAAKEGAAVRAAENLIAPKTPKPIQGMNADDVLEALRIARKVIPKNDPKLMWHGSASGELVGGKTGLHLGTYESAKQALEARVGVPAEGEWAGLREWGKTPLAGRERLLELDPRGYLRTGYNVEAPTENYLPVKSILYANKEQMPFDVRPSILPYRITGEMVNLPYLPYEDFAANARMQGLLTRGNARRGIYYKNIAEDPGSISAVVPSEKHVEPIDLKRLLETGKFSTGGTASGTMNDDVESALRIANSRLGRADGGEIPTPPRRPDDLEHYAVMADAQKKFPFINKYDPHIKVEPREDAGYAETYGPKETGDPKDPSTWRPEEFPYGSTGVRVYRPEEFTPADYAAEYLHVDPVANKTREELINRLTPEQLDFIKGQKDYQDSIGLGLSEERALNNVVDAMMRGYTMQDEPSHQWPKESLAELEFTPEELELLNSLQDYVEAPAEAVQGSMPQEPAPVEEMPARKLGGKINTIIDRDPDWRMGLDDGGLVDARTGLPPKENWTELVSRQEQGRRLEQGVPLREMAEHERYLESHPHKFRSLLDRANFFLRHNPFVGTIRPGEYPERAPPLRRFSHGGEVSDALRLARSRLAYGGLPDSYMDDDRYKTFQQMGGTRTDPRSEAIGRFLPRMTYHESRDNPLAGAKTSSAAGLGQFTKKTWRNVTEGEPEVAGKSREELYAMRRDPSEEGQRFHMRMAEKLANQNADMLEKAGLPVTPENLYAAHFGGPHGVRAAAAPAKARLRNIFSPAEINANDFLRGQTAGGFRKFAERAISETPRGLPMDLEFKRSQLPANRYEGLQTAMAGAQQQPWQVAAAPQQTPSTQMAYAQPQQRGFSADLMTPHPVPQPTRMAHLPDMQVGGQRAMAADRGPSVNEGVRTFADRGPMAGGSGPGVSETQTAMAQPMQQPEPAQMQAPQAPEPERPNQDMLEGLEQPFFGLPDFDLASLFADGGVVGDALRLATGGRTPAWTRAAGKAESGGLNAKGRASYNRANPGKPGLKPPAPHPKTEKDANRRKSFCARMKGMRRENTSAETARDPDSRINKSLRAWNCADGGQVWDKPRPKSLGEPKPLSTKQKKSAKAAAKAAGRPWPNMIDSINASKK